MRKLPVILLAALVALVAVLAPAASARQTAPQARTAEADIVATAVAAGSFTTLASLLQKAGLVDTLKGAGPFTVLAPTDEAFAKVPKATLDALAADPAKLKAVLLYHVIAGNVPSSEVVKLTSAKTVNGASVSIKVENGMVYVNGAKVVTPDVKASNGVIHVVDTVLLPAAKPQNIVQTAVAAGQFKTLASLLQKSGLAKTLQTGKWTVFAPTDAAFAKVPKATLSKVASDPVLLKKVLLYHVVKGAVPASKVVTLDGKSVKTVEGSSLKVKVSGGSVFLNGSTKVTKTDVQASNGVIHVVNKVLIPAS
jgi:transforming growth factor-beta-induced protein